MGESDGKQSPVEFVQRLCYLHCMETTTLYHKLWVRLFPKRWVLGLFLIFLFGIARVLLVMNANVTGQTQWVSIIFTLMFFTPLLFLRKAGRREMGMRKSSQPLWLLWGFHDYFGRYFNGLLSYLPGYHDDL
jgi:hypothetical protein